MIDSALGAPVVQHSARGTRLNRRGLETRRLLLDVAFTLLVEGKPGAVSANMVAKVAGATWGTVQHQFGGADGLWAAVLDGISSRAVLVPIEVTSSDIRGRVRDVVDSMWVSFGAPTAKALYTLRNGLPRDRGEFERLYPQTAESLERLDTKWNAQYERCFDGLGVVPERATRVRGLLPAALRGLHAERGLSTYTDIDDALIGFADAMALYLEFGALPGRDGGGLRTDRQALVNPEKPGGTLLSARDGTSWGPGRVCPPECAGN